MRSCEINLFKRPDNFYKPGSEVSGVLKFILNEETTANRITVSLKGVGKLLIEEAAGKKQSYRKDETYVNIQNVIQANTKEVSLPAGPHEGTFSFIIPENIPPSFHYKKYKGGYYVDCKISYYIRIKFERPGLLKFNKKFKKELNVSSVVTPKLLIPSVIYGVQKKPFNLFSKSDNDLNLKGSVENPVILPGGKLKINYEIVNNTKYEIKVVEIKLVEEYSFANNPFTGAIPEDVKATEMTTTPIKSGDTQVMSLIMDIPPSTMTIQHSTVVARDYFVYITAVLPGPHRNVTLRIPIEIQNIDLVENEENVGDDAPPSYYEAMKEYCEKEDLY